MLPGWRTAGPRAYLFHLLSAAVSLPGPKPGAPGTSACERSRRYCSAEGTAEGEPLADGEPPGADALVGLRHGEARGAAVCGNKVRADLSEWGSDAGEDGPASAVGAADTIPAPGTADGFAEGATTDTVAEGVAEGVVGEPTDGTDATAPPGVLTADGFTEGPTPEGAGTASITVGATGVVPTALGDVFRSFGDPV